MGRGFDDVRRLCERRLDDRLDERNNVGNQHERRHAEQFHDEHGRGRSAFELDGIQLDVDVNERRFVRRRR